MDIALHQQIPEFSIAASNMFCFPTGLMNVWSPSIERVLLPEEYTPKIQVEVRATSGTAKSVHFTSWKRKVYHTAIETLKGRKTLDYSGKFIFDARFNTYKNISHILDNIATRILLARKVLREHFQQEIDIHVILDGRASKHSLPKEVYGLLGIPIISTDDDVSGEIVTVSHHQIFSVKPQLFNFDFPSYKKSSFEKIFIPRRGNRRLINNDEVKSFLTERGFQTFYFEDIPVAEQWSIARNAKIVVAIHGAAVSNLIFNGSGLKENADPGSGVKVIELMSPGWIHSGFRELVNAINGRWCSVRGQITPDVLKAVDFSKRSPNSLESPFKDPFKVDCQTIQMALDYIGADVPENKLVNYFPMV